MLNYSLKADCICTVVEFCGTYVQGSLMDSKNKVDRIELCSWHSEKTVYKRNQKSSVIQSHAQNIHSLLQGYPKYMQHSHINTQYKKQT